MSSHYPSDARGSSRCYGPTRNNSDPYYRPQTSQIPLDPYASTGQYRPDAYSNLRPEQSSQYVYNRSRPTQSDLARYFVAQNDQQYGQGHRTTQQYPQYNNSDPRNTAYAPTGMARQYSTNSYSTDDSSPQSQGSLEQVKECVTYVTRPQGDARLTLVLGSRGCVSTPDALGMDSLRHLHGKTT